MEELGKSVDLCRESSMRSTSEKNSRGFEEGSTDGGVSHSSEEASNDRGAKGWQIMIA